MADPPPRINFSFAVHWCPRHLEPFRPTWPTGAVAAMKMLLDAVLVMPAVTDACGTTPDGKADATNLDAVLRRFAPLCCFVSADVREAIYVAAEVKKPPQST